MTGEALFVHLIRLINETTAEAEDGAKNFDVNQLANMVPMDSLAKAIKFLDSLSATKAVASCLNLGDEELEQIDALAQKGLSKLAAVSSDFYMLEGLDGVNISLVMLLSKLEAQTAPLLEEVSCNLRERLDTFFESADVFMIIRNIDEKKRQMDVSLAGSTALENINLRIFDEIREPHH